MFLLNDAHNPKQVYDFYDINHHIFFFFNFHIIINIEMTYIA